jgi:uncharacterized protein (UPF0276 family)
MRPAPAQASDNARPIPAKAGVGLRLPHHDGVRAQRPNVAWLEAHPENYMAAGLADELAAFAEYYPISLHAVGMSLGSASGLDHEHLLRLRALENRVRPGLMSDHLSWSTAATADGHLALPDLLPLPYTEEALAVVIANVDAAQGVLGRQLLVENPSTYLQFGSSCLSEADFLAAVIRATGCGLLLDLNNIHVSAMNQGAEPARALANYLDAVPHHAIGEIHLAGNAVRPLPGGRCVRIDDHGSKVGPEVWALFEIAIRALGPRPTLIEWDTAIPAFAVIQDEAALAQTLMDAVAAPEPVHV